MIKNFETNMAVLQKIDTKLYASIKAVEHNSRFNLQETADGLFEIYDTQNRVNISSKLDTEKHLADLLPYKEHIFLYLFGISDTSIIASLLKNKTHRRVVVVEPEIELIYIALHLDNFSSEIMSDRLRIIHEKTLNTELLISLVNEKNARFYLKVYTLMVTSSYYSNHFYTEIQKVNKDFLQAFEFIFNFAGNDVKDSLVGIAHTVKNLPLMLANPTLLDLRKGIDKKQTAIIVSTGPSLYKQLPLLKEIQDYVTIISVDASLPILEKHNILPDIVASIERVELTAKFFENISIDFLKKVTTVHAVLQHDKVTNCTTDTPRVFILRPLDYNTYFDFPEYGYIGGGLSSANLAHDIAASIGAKTCILIGQDLSYAKNGKSHSEGHVFGEDEVKKKHDAFFVEAYGGEGEVSTYHVWHLFLKRFEQSSTFYENKGMKTINSTEGGARIKGTHEIAFSSAIEQYIDKKKKKKSLKLSIPSQELIDTKTAHAKKIIGTILKEGEALQKEIEAVFLFVADRITPHEGLSIEELYKAFDDKLIISLLDEIEKIRNTIMQSPVYKDFMRQTIDSMVLPTEVDLATIKVKAVNSPDENKLKALQWIFTHKHYLFNIAGGIHNILEIVRENNSLDDA